MISVILPYCLLHEFTDSKSQTVFMRQFAIVSVFSILSKHYFGE